MSNKEYFAAQDAETVAHYMIEKLSEWRQVLNRNGLQRKWWKSYRLYYGKHFFKNLSNQDSEIVRTGDKGELAAFAVNHYRNLIKHTLAITCDQKLSSDCMAVNSDSDSLNDARNGNKILDAYLGQKKAHKYKKRAAEQAQVFGKGFVLPLWDPSLGRPYGKKFVTGDDGQPIVDDQGQPKEKVIYEGDLEFRTPSVFDVYVDQSCEDWDHRNWDNIRIFKNKFDLAVQYPHVADKILDLPGKDEIDGIKYLTFQNYNETSDVPLYYFTHKRTHSMPNGRLIIYCSDDVICYDGPIPYRDLPLKRIVPGEIFGTTEGYSDAFDLMGIQEAVNVLISIAFTNQQANGVQKIWLPEGGNLSATMLSKGLAVLRGPQGAEPKPIQLTATAKEIFEMIPLLQKEMETISGINSIARGMPDALGKNASGIAIAYVQAMAIQYNSMFQQSWAELNEEVDTAALHHLQDFATTERKVALAGKRSKGSIKSFSNQDLAPIDRVKVTLGNPLTRTISGRLQIADTMMANGQLKTPQEYLTVLETGQLDPALHAQEAELDLIHKENEDLMDGLPVKALVGDAHILHSQEHKAITDDPDLRRRAAQGDPQATQIIQNTLNHIQEHNQIWHGQSGDPFWSAIAGEPPAPPPPPPMLPPGAPGPGPEGAPPAGGPPPAAPPSHENGAGPHHPKAPQKGAHHPPLSAMMQPPPVQAHIPRLPGNLQPGQ